MTKKNDFDLEGAIQRGVDATGLKKDVFMDKYSEKLAGLKEKEPSRLISR